MSMYIYLCIHKLVYIYKYICIHIFIYISLYIIYMYSHTSICKYSYASEIICIQMQPANVFKYTYIHVHLCMYLHTCIHIHVYICILIFIYTYIHIYMNMESPHSLTTNMLACGNIVRMFKFLSCYYIRFQTYTIGDGMNSIFPQLWVK